MYCIKIPKIFINFFTLFYCLGIWHRGDEATLKERGIKFFYTIFSLLLPISLISGAITSDNVAESVFLVECSIVTMVISIKLFYVIGNRSEILEISKNVGVYSTKNRVEFKLATNKLKIFMKYVLVLLLVICANAYFAMFLPIFRIGKEVFVKIGTPWIWKNEIAFWTATAFNFTQVIILIIALLLSVIIWYVMISSALRNEILGNQIRNMGVMRISEAKKRKVSESQRQKLYLRSLTAAIDFHQHTIRLIRQVGLFFSNLLFIQTLANVTCICCSIYCLTFYVCENSVEHLIHLVILLYHIADIFMIMYFSNEIKSSSDRLMSCLFKSNWIDQPKSTKKHITSFVELLKKPQDLVIDLTYPVTLETFTAILNFAYILKNLN